MKKNNLIFLCLLLCSCSEYPIGVYGNPTSRTLTKMTPIACHSNEECGEGMFCLMTVDMHDPEPVSNINLCVKK